MGDNGMTVGMRSLWERGLFVDLTIQAEGHNFPVHKVVVMAMSDFFYGMFTGNTADRQKDEIKINGVSQVAMKNLISFMYTNVIDLNKENAAQVLEGAVYLQIPRAVEVCTEFIISHPKAENWRDSLQLFRALGLMKAADRVEPYMKKNIREIVKTVDFVQLRYSELCFFIVNWQSAEYELLRFVLKWMIADFENRERHVHLLTKVRYCLLTPRELESIKKNWCYHQNPNPWSHLVDEAVEYHDLPVHQKVLYQSEQTKIRSAPSLVLFSGGSSGENAYLWEEDEWDQDEEDEEKEERFSGYFFEPLKERCLVEHKHLNTPDEFTRCYGGIAVNNFLILYTKCSYKQRQVWYIFDPRTLQWYKMAALREDVRDYILAYDDACLYAIGGRIHQYDFNTNTWSDLRRLPSKVDSGYGVCVYDDGLYVFGGESSKRLYRLDLSTHTWEAKASMLKPQLGRNGHLMKLFGEDVISILHKRTDVQYYSFSADQWSRCTFSLSAPLPVKPDQKSYYQRQKPPKELFKGNTCFMWDVDRGETPFGEKLKACVAVTYPENGTEAVVDILCEYEGKIRRLPHRGKDDLTFLSDYRDELLVEGTYINVLAIAPHVKPLKK